MNLLIAFSGRATSVARPSEKINGSYGSLYLADTISEIKRFALIGAAIIISTIDNVKHVFFDAVRKMNKTPINIGIYRLLA